MALTINNVTKSFDNIKALDYVSAEFQDGKIYGFIGRNGAGKTTLLNCITSRLFADNGDIEIDGNNLVDNSEGLSQVFYASEVTYFLNNIKIKQLIKYQNIINPEFDAETFVKRITKCGIKLTQRYDKLSTGNRTMVRVLFALANKKRFTILDEPDQGLDAVNRAKVYEYILEDYSETNNTYIISTHLLDEAYKIVSDVVIIDKARVIYAGESESLVNSYITISGSKEEIINSVVPQDVVKMSCLGNLATAICYKREYLQENTNFTVGTVSLQDLFIALVDDKEKL